LPKKAHACHRKSSLHGRAMCRSWTEGERKSLAVTCDRRVSDAPLTRLSLAHIVIITARMSETRKEPLFFADSDDDEETEQQQAEISVTASVAPRSTNGKHMDLHAIEDLQMDDVLAESTKMESLTAPTSLDPTVPPERLFFADSDEEMDAPGDAVSLPARNPLPVAITLVDDDDDLYAPIPAAPSSQASAPSSRASPEIEIIEPTLPPRKKRRLSHPNAGPSKVVPKAKKVADASVSSLKGGCAFLGSFVCGNAFSAVKGRGYTKPGEGILITRDDVDEEPTKTFKTNGKKADPKGKGNGKKQLTLGAMMKPSGKATKRKTDNIVRITNPRGFGATSCVHGVHLC
jgi:hypothetical protein